MRRLYQKITPNFLKRWDHRLLIHHPWIWATRIHHVGFCLLISIGMLGGLGWVQMNTFVSCIQQDYDAIENTLLCIQLCKFLGLGFWAWALTQHHWLDNKVLLSSRQSLLRMGILGLGAISLGALPLFYGAFVYALGFPAESLLNSEFWPYGWGSIVVFTPFWWLMLEIASYVKKLELGGAMVGRLLIMVFSFFLYDVLSGLGLSGDWLMSWGIFAYVLTEVLLLLKLGYSSKRSRFKINFQIIALSIVPIIFSFIQFFWLMGSLYGLFFEDSLIALTTFYVVYFGCIGFALVVWHFLLRKRVIRLHLQARA